MKMVTLLVPAYNGLSHIERHEEFWKEVTRYAEVILVEDSDKESMRSISEQMGFEYYSKANGNWGSVINFARENNIIKTKWVTIFDVDDTMDIVNFLKLQAILSVTKKYVVSTKVVHRDYRTEKVVMRTFPGPFAHRVWIRTEVFGQLPALPERVFYTDNHFELYLRNNFKINRPKLKVYNYYVNVPGQSIDFKTPDQFKSKIPSMIELSKIFEWAKENNLDTLKLREEEFAYKKRFIKPALEQAVKNNNSELIEFLIEQKNKE